MAFKENGADVQNAHAKELNNKATHNGEAKKENGHAKTDHANSNGKAATEIAKPTPAKDEKPAENQPEQQKVEQAQKESPVQEGKNGQVLPGIGLERTLKTVHALYRESVKRDNLIGRIEELEKFEIQLMEESDELENNHFQGCKLAIYDSKGRTFITNTSNLIKMVAEFVKTSCYKKLAEIESGIVFPQN
jgi:hypothetical protein